jgi:hypothetical protein
MTTRTIDLSEGAMRGENPHDLAVIEAEMVWPDDDNTRQEFYDSSFVQLIKENSEGQSRDTLRKALSLALTVRPLHRLRNDDYNKRVRHGFIVGLILNELLCRISENKDSATMDAVITQVGVDFDLTWAGGGQFMIAKKTIQNEIWK